MTVTKNVKEDTSRIEDDIADKVKEVLTRYMSKRAVIDMEKWDNGIHILDRRNYLYGGTYSKGVAADVGMLGVSIFPKDSYISIQVVFNLDHMTLPVETKRSDLENLFNDLVKTIEEKADKFEKYDILIATRDSNNPPVIVKEISVKKIRKDNIASLLPRW